MKLAYSSNNSGGSWWLKDRDWYALEKAGWDVDWYSQRGHDQFMVYKDGRFLGALSSGASKEVADREAAKEAVLEFEAITGQNVDDHGCTCCGPPHSFTLYDDDDRWVGSFDSSPAEYDRNYF